MAIKNKSFYIVLDIVTVCISVFLAALVREQVQGKALTSNVWYCITVLLLAYAVTILFYQPEKPLMKRGGWKELVIVGRINFYMAVFTTLSLYLVRGSSAFPRSFYLLFFLFDTILMYVFRTVLKQALLRFYSKPENRKRLVLFANEENVLKMMHKYVISHMFDYEPVGVISISGHRERDNLKIEINRIIRDKNKTHMEVSSETLEEFLMHQAIDEALISLPCSRRQDLHALIQYLSNLGIDAHVTTNTFGLQAKETVLETFGVYQVLTYSPRVFEPTELALKRLMDMAGSLVGIVITLILGLFLAPAIYLESPGPVIFKQTRIGKNGRRFSIYKFRSMYMDAEERKKELMAQNEMNGLMFKIKDDPRTTKVGRFIRKTSLDEFPQFFNVLAGDMSLVGTRPPTEDEFLQYSEHHKRRLSLKPGITGMWQVSGRSEITSFEDVVSLDLEYIDHWSIWLDIKLIFQTIYVVLFQRGAS